MSRSVSPWRTGLDTWEVVGRAKAPMAAAMPFAARHTPLFDVLPRSSGEGEPDQYIDLSDDRACLTNDCYRQGLAHEPPCTTTADAPTGGRAA